MKLIEIYVSERARSLKITFLWRTTIYGELNTKKWNYRHLRDTNVRVGNMTIPIIKHGFNEDTKNRNWELLFNFYAHNEFRINVTFFKHKDQTDLINNITRSDTSKTQIHLEINEMTIFSRISLKGLYDKVRIEEIRRISGVKNTISWVKHRKEECNQYISKTPVQRIVRDKLSSGGTTI